MNIGLIGPGEIGAVIVRKLRDAGYPVKMANSKGPDSLRKLAAETGAKPVSVEEVVQDVDLLFIVLPQKAIPELPKGLLNKKKRRPSPVYCTNPTKEELQKRLKNVDRSSLVTNREKGMKAHFAVEHRDSRT